MEAEAYDLDSQQEETVAICGLLHDICKANFYGVETLALFVLTVPHFHTIEVGLADVVQEAADGDGL